MLTQTSGWGTLGARMFGTQHVSFIASKRDVKPGITVTMVFAVILARIALSVCSGVNMIVGISLLWTGVRLYTQDGKILANMKFLDKIKGASSGTGQAPDNIEDLDVPLLTSIANWLVAIALLLLFVSLLGCLAACCYSALAFLIPLVIIYLVVWIGTNVMVTLLRTPGSAPHVNWEAQSANDLRNNYKDQNVDDTAKVDTFSEVIDFMQIQVECCGSKGPGDYKPNPVPKSCCIKEIYNFRKSEDANATLAAAYKRCMDDRTPQPGDIYNEGCYGKMFKNLLKLEANYEIVIYFFVNICMVVMITCVLIMMWYGVKSADPEINIFESLI